MGLSYPVEREREGGEEGRREGGERERRVISTSIFAIASLSICMHLMSR